MITSKYDWQLASPSADEAFLALAKKAGLEAPGPTGPGAQRIRLRR